MGKEESKASKKAKKHSQDIESTKRKDKDKKKHKHKKRRGSSSFGSSSDSGEEVLSPKEQLKRERQAVNILRDLLYTHSQARKDLRELLWTIDQGKVASLAGVPDDSLRLQLQEMLRLLGLRKVSSSKASFMLAPGHATTLSILGFVFDETPRPPKPQPQPQPAKHIAKASAVVQDSSAQLTTVPKQHHQQQREQQAGERSDQADRGGAAPPDISKGQSAHPLDNDVPAVSHQRPAGRQVGPAMPSPEMLAAAAAAAMANAAGSDLNGERGPSEEGYVEDVDDEEEEEEDLVGPAPPDLLEEVDAAPQNAREEEVLRIMRVLRESVAAQGQPGKPSSSTADVPLLNAYEVLGVTQDTPVGDVKKRYMRLSLLIHPDKCQHKDAHEAFQAVAKAAKVLQDSGARLQLDEAREDQRLRRMAAAAAAQMERERAWRVARGEEPPPGAPGASAPGPTAIVREAWMTELPPERQAGLSGLMNQVSQRAFSKASSKPRGDTSEWTDTPQQRAAKAAGLSLQGGAAGPAMLTGGGTGSSTAAGMRAPSAQVMDAYNTQKRPKSLLEIHQEKQAAAQQGSAKKAKVEHPDGPPWRPFNRDELELKPTKTVDAQKLLKNAAMGNKFASAGGTRHFL